MDSTWWTNNGEDAQLEDQFTFAEVEITKRPYTNMLWDRYRVYGSRMYQRSYIYNGNHDKWNGGHFYLRHNTTGAIEYAADAMQVAGNNYTPRTGRTPEVDTLTFEGPRLPLIVLPDHIDADERQVVEFYVTSSPKDIAIGSGQYSLFHYSPYTFWGYPAEVIASIVLKIGVDEDYIDKDSFDNAYNGQTTDYSVGEQIVMYAREINVEIAEGLKEIARHCHDPLYFNMAGQIAMGSRSRPPTLTALHGITSVDSHVRTSDYICNTMRATGGMVSITSASGHQRAPTETNVDEEERLTHRANDEYTCKAEWREKGDWYGDDEAYVVEANNTTSQTNYGLIAPGGPVRIYDDSGELKYEGRDHYRLFVQADSLDGIAARVDEITGPRSKFTITQDFRGMDYDIGYQIDWDDADISPAYETDNFMCISKEIDFDSLTVTSTLLSVEDYGFKSRGDSSSGFTSGFSTGYGGPAWGFDSGFNPGFGV